MKNIFWMIFLSTIFTFTTACDTQDVGEGWGGGNSNSAIADGGNNNSAVDAGNGVPNGLTCASDSVACLSGGSFVVSNSLFNGAKYQNAPAVLIGDAPFTPIGWEVLAAYEVNPSNGYYTFSFSGLGLAPGDYKVNMVSSLTTDLGSSIGLVIDRTGDTVDQELVWAQIAHFCANSPLCVQQVGLPGDYDFVLHWDGTNISAG